MFYNSTQPVGVVMDMFSQNITGSVFLTLFFIMLIFLAIVLMSGLPLEFGLVFILPLLMVMIAYEAGFLIIGGTLIVLLGFIMGLWFFK